MKVERSYEKVKRGIKVARQVKDRFRDWNLLHKSVVALIAAFTVGVVYHLVVSIDAAYEMKGEIIINQEPETIWPWVHSAELRPDWQGELIDIAPYMGEDDKTESTRLLFWKRGFKHWQAVEKTTEVVQYRLYGTAQEADRDYRTFRVELEPLGPCETRVKLREVIEPATYEDRFWFFTSRSRSNERTEISLKALKRWVSSKSPECEAGD